MAFSFSNLIISIIIIINIIIIIVKPTLKQNAIASFKDCLRYFSCKAFETFLFLFKMDYSYKTHNDKINNND